MRNGQYIRGRSCPIDRGRQLAGIYSSAFKKKRIDILERDRDLLMNLTTILVFMADEALEIQHQAKPLLECLFSDDLEELGAACVQVYWRKLSAEEKEALVRHAFRIRIAALGKYCRDPETHLKRADQILAWLRGDANCCERAHTIVGNENNDAYTMQCEEPNAALSKACELRVFSSNLDAGLCMLFHCVLESMSTQMRRASVELGINSNDALLRSKSKLHKYSNVLAGLLEYGAQYTTSLRVLSTSLAQCESEPWIEAFAGQLGALSSSDSLSYPLESFQRLVFFCRESEANHGQLHQWDNLRDSFLVGKP